MVFAWMIMRASWKATRVRYKGRSVTLQRGQLVTSYRDIATAMDRDKMWIGRLLKRLVRETMVDTQGDTGLTIVTICNYDKFQTFSPVGETVDEKVEAVDERHGRDTEQEDKENLEEINMFADGERVLGKQYTAAFETWWSEYPNKVGKGAAAKSYERAAHALKVGRHGQRVHDRLLGALKAQKTVWKRKGVGGKYIPHASTWLGQSRFDDEAVVAEMERARSGGERPPKPEAELQPPDPKPQQPERRRKLAPAGWTPGDGDS